MNSQFTNKLRRFVLICSTIIFLFSCSGKVEKEITEVFPGGQKRVEKFYRWKGNQKEYIKEIVYSPTGSFAKKIDYISKDEYKETRYYPDGLKKSEGNFLNNNRHGKWTYWYENEQKWSEAIFDNGTKNGKNTVWYKDGTINYKGNFKNGKPHGEWEFYVDGELSKTAVFNNGTKESEKSH